MRFRVGRSEGKEEEGRRTARGTTCKVRGRRYDNAISAAGASDGLRPGQKRRWRLVEVAANVSKAQR